MDTTPDSEQWMFPGSGRHAHWDLSNGVSGDMMLAACLDAAGDHSDAVRLRKNVDSWMKKGLPNLSHKFSMHMSRFEISDGDDTSSLRVAVVTVPKGNIQSEPSIAGIRQVLESGDQMYIPEWLLDTAMEVFLEMARAQKAVQGLKSVSDVVFPGDTTQLIVHVVGVLLCLYALGAETVTHSPFPALGSDSITDPVTEQLLKTVATSPAPSGVIVTATGVALLKVLSSLTDSENPNYAPPMALQATGVGGGANELSITRLMLGDTSAADGAFPVAVSPPPVAGPPPPSRMEELPTVMEPETTESSERETTEDEQSVPEPEASVDDQVQNGAVDEPIDTEKAIKAASVEEATEPDDEEPSPVHQEPKTAEEPVEEADEGPDKKQVEQPVEEEPAAEPVAVESASEPAEEEGDKEREGSLDKETPMEPSSQPTEASPTEKSSEIPTPTEKPSEIPTPDAIIPDKMAETPAPEETADTKAAEDEVPASTAVVPEDTQGTALGVVTTTQDVPLETQPSVETTSEAPVETEKPLPPTETPAPVTPTQATVAAAAAPAIREAVSTETQESVKSATPTRKKSVTAPSAKTAAQASSPSTTGKSPAPPKAPTVAASSPAVTKAKGKAITAATATTTTARQSGSFVSKLGNTAEFESDLWKIETVTHLEANLDDMTPESLAFATDVLLQSGAIDAWIIPIIMKKGRPGHTLHCICRSSHTKKLLEIIYRQTTTLGVRIHTDEMRAVIRRSIVNVYTPWVDTQRKGQVSIKIGFLGKEVVSVKPEFEHCKEISQEAGVPLKQVSETAIRIAHEKMEAYRNKMAGSS